MKDESANIKCTKCGSLNTKVIHPFNTRPRVLHLIVIGWIIIPIQSAFSKSKIFCKKCNHEESYRTTASWLSIFFLLFLAIILLINFEKE